MRLFLRLLAVALLAAAAAVGWVVLRSPDPKYLAHEWLARPKFWEFDELIVSAAERYRVDPKLVKAIVWRESRFSPEKKGAHGERGLMQITEAAAQDWARAEKLETFVPTDLFDPQNNLRAGSWYVGKALERWKERDDPVPFALAEYNAGRGRVERWIAKTGKGDRVTAAEFLTAMDFPLTRQYIEDVTERRRFYERRGRL